jgi:outer membrane protein TolC
MRTLQIIMALFLFSSISLFAQKKITLQDAIETSLENNHNIKLAEYDLRLAEEDVKEAFGYALPTVTMNGGYNHFLDVPDFVFGGGGFFPQEFMDYNNLVAQELNLGFVPFPADAAEADPAPIPGGLRNTFSTGIELRQTLFNYTVFNGIGATGTYKKVQEENLNAKESNTVKDSKMAFYGALLAKESIGLVEQSLENAQKRYEEISVLFENGLVSEYDQLRSSVQVENLKSEKSNAETSFQTALNGLKITIGLDPTEEVEIDGELEDYQKTYSTPEKSETQKEIFDGNYDLKAVDLQVEVSDAFVENEFSTLFPVLNLIGSYSFQGQSDDFDFVTFEQSLVGLQLSWTLYQGGQRYAKLQKAKIEKQKAEVQRDLLERSLNNQAELLALRMKTAKEQIDAGLITVDQANRGYEIANTRYQEGVGSLLEINDADLALRQARLNKLQAVYNYLTAKAEFDNLKGEK